jgi:hypothetical protein
MPLAKEIFPRAILGTRAIGSSVLLQLRHMGDMQRNSGTRQYRISPTFIQKHNLHWHVHISAAHLQGFCWIVCLCMVLKCWRWETWGECEVTIVRDLRKHLDLRYAHCKERSLQKIMRHLSQQLQRKMYVSTDQRRIEKHDVMALFKHWFTAPYFTDRWIQAEHKIG